MKLNRKQIKIFVVALAGLALAGLVWRGGRLPAADELIVSLQNNPAVTSAPRSVREVMVTKVIDGDTVVVAGGDSVRLLGIDADEKGCPCYGAARTRLQELVLEKTVKLEAGEQDLDQYGRQLRYVFSGGVNISKQMAAEGLAIALFYPENQKYKDEIVAAEAQAMKSKVGCKWNGGAQATSTAPQPDSANETLDWQKIGSGKAINACDAKNHIGEEVVVEGVVADSYSSGTGTVFLNFGGKYPDNCFAAVIFKSSLSKFPGSPETIYRSKNVRVKGAIKKLEGKPEIIVDDPSQIDVGF